MATRYFVEILNRSNDVERRQEITRFPARIGRAYDVDILIDDPFVDSHHVVLTLGKEGELMAEDLGSQNGTARIVGRKVTPLQAAITLEADDRLRIGQTMLRVRPDTHAVPAALPLPAKEPRRPLKLLLAMLTVILLVHFNEFYRPAEEFIERMPGVSLITMSLLAIGSGIMALVGRAFSRRLDYFRHLLILCVGTAAIMLNERIFSVVRFAFGLGNPVLIEMSVVSLLVALTLHHHLRLFVRIRHATLFGIALIISSALVGSPWLFDKLGDSSDRSKDERSSQVVLPPEFLLTQGVTVDEFLVAVGQARAGAERLAAVK